MVTFGDNSGMVVIGVGTFECRIIKLKDVFFVEGQQDNFISISQIWDGSYKVLFNRHVGKVVDSENKIMLIAIRENDIYMV